ncbi:MAG: Maf family protein [Nanoarchaeota archaeon]|nr:septum formation protein Maf [Nanoarchaeota archaeon]MBU4451856.1 septum formation protein Maf [Nanoarchaeota archaeon]MCG2724408.1 Maf family protein [archaeon]
MCPTIILASKSNGRAKILREACFAFDSVHGNVDESAIREKSPEELVKKLALAKAEDVALKADAKAVVIGADTVCVFGGKFIGKPRDKDDAFRMLSAFSGKTHMLFTGIAVLCMGDKKSLVDVSVSTVTFRTISKAEIDDYLTTDDAMNFAGGYNIDATKSMRFIEGISGSYTGVIGMPLEKLVPMLKKCGFDY